MRKGSKNTPEVIEKMKLAHSGKKLSDHHKQMICLANSGTGNWMYGRKHSEETKKKIGLANSNEKNGLWKGDKVGYLALHTWIKKRLPKPELCNRCKLVPPLDLANKSSKYLRDITDWEYLCRRCHLLSDGRMKNLMVFASPEARRASSKKAWDTMRTRGYRKKPIQK